MTEYRGLVLRVNEVSRGFYRDFLSIKSEEARHVLAQCDEMLFNLRDLSAEIFHRFFQEPHPEFIEFHQIPPENRWALHFHRELSDSPEFDALASRTECDALASGTATLKFMSALLQRMPDPPRGLRDPGPMRSAVKLLKAAPNPGAIEQRRLDRMIKAGKESVAKLDEWFETLKERLQVIEAAVEKSLEEAGEAVAVLVEMDEVTGWSLNEGLPMQVSTAQKMKLSDLLTKNATVRHIFKIAGRMLDQAQQKRRSEKSIGMGELANVTLGNELDRLLPSELMKLAVPQLRPLFYAQFLERTLLEYEMKADTSKDKGCLVLCVDDSGSMAGQREEWAKALILVMMRLCRTDRRDLRIILFAQDIDRVVDVKPGEPNFHQMMEQISARYNGGGTYFIPPLTAAMEAIEREQILRKADILFVTDGHGGISEAFLKRFKERKEALGFNVYGMFVDSSARHPPIMDSFCDKVFHVADLNSAQSVMEIF